MAPGAINLALGAPKLAPGLIKKCIETRYLIKGERNFAPWPKNYKLCPDKISGLAEEYPPLAVAVVAVAVVDAAVVPAAI